ncbi:MAG: hypothetical protein M3552_01045 [Planctomycetota bacterium]|nr:hypothetical protein [Planctomycetaceae bacterium]MDQ3329232.1 hypothetical protein [Planctomycetota bacterium]
MAFDAQQQVSERLRELNGCGPGRRWDDTRFREHPSETGTPVVTLHHTGGHSLPPEAPALIAKFFKSHSLPEPIANPAP